MRQAVYESVKTNITGITLDNIIYDGAFATSRMRARQLSQMDISMLVANSKVAILCRIVLPIVDFPQYSSNSTILETLVRVSVQTAVNTGTFMETVLQLSTSTLFDTVSLQKVDFIIDINPPEPEPQAQTKTMSGTEAGQIIIGSIIAVGVLVGAIYYIYAYFKQEKEMMKPDDRDGRSPNGEFDMDEIFQQPDQFKSPENFVVYVGGGNDEIDLDMADIYGGYNGLFMEQVPRINENNEQNDEEEVM